MFEKEQLGKTFFFKVPEKKNSVQLTVKATTTANTQIAQNYTVTKPADAEGNSNLVSGDEFTVNIDAGNGTFGRSYNSDRIEYLGRSDDE